MILGDKKILKLIEENKLIENFEKDNLQPASYDLRIDHVDDRFNDWILKSGECRLISTKEKVNMPNNVGAICKTKSSLARLGVIAGDVGGWIDPGFKGEITIALFNFGRKDIDLEEIKSTTQLIFFEVTDIENAYDGHYQNSNGLVESRFL